MFTLGHDGSGLIWLLVFFLLVLPVLRGRFRPGHDHWRERQQEWKERGEQRRDEERAFRDQLLSELKRHNAVAERQNELMAQAIERLNKVSEPQKGSSKPPLSPEI